MRDPFRRSMTVGLDEVRGPIGLPQKPSGPGRAVKTIYKEINGALIEIKVRTHMSLK